MILRNGEWMQTGIYRFCGEKLYIKCQFVGKLKVAKKAGFLKVCHYLDDKSKGYAGVCRSRVGEEMYYE